VTRRIALVGNELVAADIVGQQTLEPAGQAAVAARFGDEQSQNRIIGDRIVRLCVCWAR
jgi:hypothetical protein